MGREAEFKLWVEEKIRDKKWFCAEEVRTYVNEELLADEVLKRKSKFSLSTVTVWLILAGFIYDQYKKAIYVDGHEREDVIEVWSLLYSTLSYKAAFYFRLVLNGSKSNMIADPNVFYQPRKKIKTLCWETILSGLKIEKEKVL